MAAFAVTFVLVLFGVFPGLKPSRPPGAVLEFWGMQDDEEDWRDILSKFHSVYPHLTVQYQRLDEKSYEETLVNSLAAGRGPDVFVLKNSWIVKHRDKLFPFPADSFDFSVRDFSQTFVDAASEDLISANGEIVGFPIFIDTLALFYNRDIFNSSGVAQPPRSWDEVSQVSRSLTKKTAVGDITKSGLALGAAQNIEHFFEILSSLFMQNGNRIIDHRTNALDLGGKTSEALTFYASFTNFSSQNFSWTIRMPDSFDALAAEQSSMVFGFSRDLARLRAKNPHLNFAVAPFPQTKGSGSSVVYADYFFPTVSKFSKSPEAAWQFVSYIASRDIAESYLAKTARPAARRDLISAGPPPALPELDVFYRQSLIARSWAVPDYEASRRLFKDAIEAVSNKTVDSADAVNKLREQLRLLLP